MRVQCCLCEHEEGGFCFKKKRGGKPIKIKSGKRRTCVSYSEEAVRVLTDFRKRETHKATLRNQDKRRVLIEKAIEDAKQKGIDTLIKHSTPTEPKE